MDAPVVGVEIDIVMFDRGARLAVPAFGAGALRHQPFPHTVEIRGSQLPFQLAVIGGCGHIGTAFTSARTPRPSTATCSSSAWASHRSQVEKSLIGITQRGMSRASRSAVIA